MGAIARLGPRQPVADPAALASFVSSQLGRSTKLDRSYRVYASQRRVRFTEMEYAIPRRHAAEAVPRVLDAAERAEPRRRLPDRGPLRRRRRLDAEPRARAGHQPTSPSTSTRGMAWEGYFRAVEEVMDDYGGRPHWGKRHFQTADDAGRALPALGGLRGRSARRLDPDGRFRNDYLDRVLGPIQTHSSSP